MSNTETVNKPIATKDRRKAIDMTLVQPLLAAAITAADEKSVKLFTRSPSLLAARIADEAQEKGICKDREEWRFVYWNLKETVVPTIFPNPKKQPKQEAAPAGKA